MILAVLARKLILAVRARKLEHDPSKIMCRKQARGNNNRVGRRMSLLRSAALAEV